MRIIRSIPEIRGHVGRARAAGRTIGLVPTMGAFHAGHESLMRAARASCGEVIVSLFVNPAQFNDTGDLAAYPRYERQDAAIAAELGVDVLFAPPPDEIYPDGFATSVTVAGLSDVLEGTRRGAGHFAGVCTVVAKLFNIVAPDVAFVGQKDAQQATVLRRMARDLDFPLALEVLPTVREPDGLAMSSRNERLSPTERERAVALWRALAAAQEAVAAGDDEPALVEAAVRDAMAPFGVEPEYVALVDPETFLPPARVDRRALVAVAAWVGNTRLIDNVLIERAATPAGRGVDPKGAQRVLPAP